MKKFGKIIALILAMLMICTAFASCKTPDKTPDTTPGGNTDTTPGGDEGTTPGGDEGTTPGGDEGTTPGGDEGTTPGGEDEPKDDFYTLEATPVDKSASCIPNFTDRQIKNQMTKGATIASDIKAAAADLSKTSYTIAPGNYGFKLNNSLSGYSFPYGFLLEGVKRPDDNPFTIIAEGVTFWFEPTGFPCATASAAFLIKDCENIKIVGLTLDEYTPNDIEGTITQMDFVNNRIAIKLTNSSMVLDKDVIKSTLSGSQCRIVPYKATGEFIAGAYKPGDEWGPGSMQISKIAATDNENEYWLTFRTTSLMDAISKPEWKAHYGSLGTVEVGDVVSLLYGNILVSLGNSKHVTMEGLKDHMTKGMPGEEGGYGGHVWKDCYFGPRPGSSKVMTAGEFMIQATRHGTTFDNVTIMSSSDDQINLHGFWGNVMSTKDNTATMQYTNPGLIAGDEAHFYKSDGTYLGKLILAEDASVGSFGSRKFTFTENVPDEFRGATVRFPALECDGWTVKNCTFINNYQSMLFSSGSGVFENNKIITMGNAFGLSTDSSGLYEGGKMGTIIFRNNVFYNCAVTPNFSMFYITQSANFKGSIKIDSIQLVDNLFVNCGNLLTANYVTELTITGNIFVEPRIYGKEITDFSKIGRIARNTDTCTFADNVLYAEKCDGTTDESNNANLKIDKELSERITFYVKNSDKDAKGIIETVKANLK